LCRGERIEARVVDEGFYTEKRRAGGRCCFLEVNVMIADGVRVNYSSYFGWEAQKWGGFAVA